MPSTSFTTQDPSDRSLGVSLALRFETSVRRTLTAGPRGMQRDPKQFVIAAAGLYALFQLVTQTANPSSYSSRWKGPLCDSNSSWRPPR